MFRAVSRVGWKKFAVLTTTLLTGLVAAIVLAGPAGAHTSSMNAPTTVCDHVTGTYTITYTGQGDYNLNSTVSLVSALPAGTTVTPQSQTVIPVKVGNAYKDPFTLVQTGVAGTATSASITVTELWTDKVKVTVTGTATYLKGDCTKNATPTSPSFTDDVCHNYAPSGASYTIPATTGVIYKVNGSTVAAGTYPATDGSTITITATAATGYTLTGTTTFTHTFVKQPTCTTTVVATAPTFTDSTCHGIEVVGASYTIPTTTGVIYKVNGSTVAAGTYPATDGSTITITATAATGYTLSGTTTFTHTFAAKPTCTTAAVVSAPTFVDSACKNTTATGSSYTIPAVTGVVYKIGADTVAAGTYAATDGSSLTITVTPAAGYTLTGTTTFTHTFPAKPTCAEVASTQLAFTGTATSVPVTVGIGALLVAIGAMLAIAGHRRRRSS